MGEIKAQEICHSLTVCVHAYEVAMWPNYWPISAILDLFECVREKWSHAEGEQTVLYRLICSWGWGHQVPVIQQRLMNETALTLLELLTSSWHPNQIFVCSEMKERQEICCFPSLSFKRPHLQVIANGYNYYKTKCRSIPHQIFSSCSQSPCCCLLLANSKKALILASACYSWLA